jgi:hypothetical protein
MKASSPITPASVVTTPNAAAKRTPIFQFFIVAPRKGDVARPFNLFIGSKRPS